jgi:hypothetical protein
VEELHRGEEEAALERVLWQTRRSHVVAPPPTPTREEDSFFLILYMMLIFLCLLSFSSWLDTNWDGRGHRRQVNQILGNLIHLHYPELVTKGGHSEPVTT